MADVKETLVKVGAKNLELTLEELMEKVYKPVVADLKAKAMAAVGNPLVAGLIATGIDALAPQVEAAILAKIEQISTEV